MNELDLARELIAVDTVSPVRSVAPYRPIIDILEERGIDHEIREYDGVQNLTAEIGSGSPRLCFNGHLDVVAPGTGWTVTDPFEPLVSDGRLYGRGAADMKAGVAAEVAAFVDLHESSTFDGSVVLMIAGDEELGGVNGTARMVESYADVEYAIVGEPTDLDVQVATRGTLWIDVILEGTPVHVARSHLGENVIEDLPGVISALSTLELEYEPDDILPDPGFEVTVVRTDDTQNSLPGTARIGIDVRTVPGQTPAGIRRQIHAVLEPLGVEYAVETTDHGGPCKLIDDRFRQATVEVMTDLRDAPVREITDGGASDGRFFAARGVPFVELGTSQKPAHQADEHCPVGDLQVLRTAYAQIAERLAAERGR